MKINFTKKQYLTLIKLIYLGTWITNAHRTEDIIEEFEDLEQYILSFARDFGMEDEVVYDDEIGKFFLDEEFIVNSGIEEIIDEYDNETFWEELIHRLSERDLNERYGEDALSNMALEDVLMKKMPLLEMYDTEFSENGLVNLRLIKGT